MPILTFTSDFGTSDHLVGGVKGEILKLNEGFTIIDISHDIIPYNFMQAAYVCKSIFKNFPHESFHLVLVNSFDNDADHLLLVNHNGHYIGLPDNGLITMILEERPQHVVALPIPSGSAKTIRSFTRIFIDAFSAILSGVKLEKIGNQDIQFNEKTLMKPYATDNYIEGQILMIDRFLNVIVNITKEQFEYQRKGRRFKIVLLRDTFIETISQHYGEVPEGEKLAFFNESGYLEVAINKGYAAPLFGLGEYAGSGPHMHDKRQYYQT
ncbi:MAG: S-adenosyl-l-methionine hydroxide adenosyltransferase family protein, partial [bacterium]